MTKHNLDKSDFFGFFQESPIYFYISIIRNDNNISPTNCNSDSFWNNYSICIDITTPFILVLKLLGIQLVN